MIIGKIEDPKKKRELDRIQAEMEISCVCSDWWRYKYLAKEYESVLDE